jgi:hypothetical protein
MASIQKLLQQLPDWGSFVSKAAHKVLSQIERCHTPAMGYHAYKCEDATCKHLHLQYHGCRNRHCPHCGQNKAQQWMENRLKELLPVRYFHVVFTLPSELHGIAYINRKRIFKLLFDSAAHCLLTLSKDPKYLGATPSISMVLHSWGQLLQFHPHVHCIVSGGGADKQHQWVKLKKGNGFFLFPKKVMEQIYRGYFLDHLNKLIVQGKIILPANTNWKKLKNTLYQKDWMVYAKHPMGNAHQVIEYLGRYTQKIAISNYRIKQIDAQNRVHFWYKDYRQKGKRKLMVLEGKEFLRRFAQHILPARFVRIRHYGILGNYKRKERVALILKKMKVPQHAPKIKWSSFILRLCEQGKSSFTCPACKKADMVLVGIQWPQSRAGPANSLAEKRGV